MNKEVRMEEAKKRIEQYDQDCYLLGENLKNARNRAGFTQSQLGDLIGTNKAQISRYEHNKTIPDTKTIFKILVALQISPNELLLKDY